MAPRFDLQSHSTHSDGALPAGEVVQRAADAGVELLALSDHDTISGVAEASPPGERVGRARRARRRDLGRRRRARGAPRELHILGYRIDYTGPPMTTRLDDFLADREKRTLRMRDGAARGRLRARRSRDRRSASPTANRSAARTSRPPCCARPPTPSACSDEDIDDVGSLIRGYLIEGKPAFRLRETPTVAEAIEAIHDAGGVAIWAHPFWDIADPDEVLASIDRFHALGIDGVEAFYITHDARADRAARQRAAPSSAC